MLEHRPAVTPPAWGPQPAVDRKAKAHLSEAGQRGRSSLEHPVGTLASPAETSCGCWLPSLSPAVRLPPCLLVGWEGL